MTDAEAGPLVWQACIAKAEVCLPPWYCTSFTPSTLKYYNIFTDKNKESTIVGIVDTVINYTFMTKCLHDYKLEDTYLHKINK